MRTRLEAGGIAAFLVDENVTQIEWGFFTGGVRVQVADEDATAARELLAAQNAEGDAP